MSRRHSHGRSGRHNASSYYDPGVDNVNRAMEFRFKKAMDRARIGGYEHGSIIEGREVDFYFHKQQLAVEIDGYFHVMEKTRIKDACKESLLHDRGIEVVRFTNDDIRYYLPECIRKLQMKLRERADSMGKR